MKEFVGLIGPTESDVEKKQTDNGAEDNFWNQKQPTTSTSYIVTVMPLAQNCLCCISLI